MNAQAVRFDRPGGPEVARARTVFNLLRTEVIAGQYLDLRLAAEPEPSEDVARRVAHLKTARYTVTRPLQMGAALGVSAFVLAATVGGFRVGLLLMIAVSAGTFACVLALPAHSLHKAHQIDA